jgi:CRP-like cAMP-binding protein
MTNYMFKDVFYNFRQFFLTYENRETKFLYEVSFGFKPRLFEKKEIIYEEGDEVSEMYFILSGSV